MGSVLRRPAPGQAARGHVSRSLSAFNSQLPALIAAVFLLPAAPGGHARLQQHTSSCSSASLLLKADEQPGAPQLSPRSGSSRVRFLPAFKASADGRRQPNTLAKKTRLVFPEIPLISSLPMLRDPSSIAIHFFFAGCPTRARRAAGTEAGDSS